MKKFSFLISVLFLAACGTQTAPTSNITSSGVENPVSENVIINTSIVGEKITNDPGYMQCMDTARHTCGVNFINAYALNNSDEAICHQFSDENLRLACRDLVITETAKKTLDESRCHALSDDKKISCVQDVVLAKAIKKQDPTVCSNYIASSTDTDTLENLKDRCVMYVIDSMQANDKTFGLCGLLLDASRKEACEQKITEMIKISQNVDATIPSQEI